MTTLQDASLTKNLALHIALARALIDSFSVFADAAVQPECRLFCFLSTRYGLR
jgi:hypothetical protein